MIGDSIFTATACAGLMWAASSVAVRAEPNPEELYTTASKSIVTLEVETVSGRHFVGSGFLAVGEGLAVTAWHVVHDARRVEARFADNKHVIVAGVVDKNESLDLALLALETGTRPRIGLGTTAPRIGSRVYLIGSPRGLDFSISEGLVGQIRSLDGITYYQLSCPISPGDSGGPVLNDRGEAIGVVSWRKADAENVGFAIPSTEVERMNPQLPIVAWSKDVSPADSPGTTQEITPRVRTAVPAEKPGPADNYREFQDFLTNRAGKRVTVIVQEGDKEHRFRFEVPKRTSN